MKEKKKLEKFLIDSLLREFSMKLTLFECDNRDINLRIQKFVDKISRVELRLHIDQDRYRKKHLRSKAKLFYNRFLSLKELVKLVQDEEKKREEHDEEEHDEEEHDEEEHEEEEHDEEEHEEENPNWSFMSLGDIVAGDFINMDNMDMSIINF
tara:strand:+ start:92 stop:550 length:459 start_codon:yes stop_codon:yes gene_type:complete